ncbi:hypothetical protein ACWKSP_14805 [Micromonosporaceae bacterium Da 78-11]
MTDPPDPRRTPGRRTHGRRALAVVLAGLLLTVAGYGGYAVHRARLVVSLAPAGPYPVGRSLQQWADRSRTDQFAPIGGLPRVLSVWLWYPAAPGVTGTPSEYAPGAWRGLHTFGWAATDPGRVHTGTLDDVPLAAGVFPLVVLLPGLGLAAPQYTAVASALAARGYLVAGVTPTYSAELTVLNTHPVRATNAGAPPDLGGPRGAELLAVWADDARFAADQAALRFGGQVDVAHTVYLGHGLGGAAAVEACRADPRCAGAATLAGDPAPTGKPLLTLNSPGATDGRAYTVDGLAPFDFTDYAAYHLAGPLRRVLPLGPIDGRRALGITTAYLAAFLDSTTHGTAWTAPAYPEVHAADPGGR